MVLYVQPSQPGVPRVYLFFKNYAADPRSAPCVWLVVRGSELGMFDNEYVLSTLVGIPYEASHPKSKSTPDRTAAEAPLLR